MAESLGGDLRSAHLERVDLRGAELDATIDGGRDLDALRR